MHPHNLCTYFIMNSLILMQWSQNNMDSSVWVLNVLFTFYNDIFQIATS